MKHTPGPWKWDEPSNWLGLEARVFVAEPYGVVAQVPIEAWRPRSIGKANARLIAAAPELLEALKEALGFIEALEFFGVMPEQVVKPDVDAIKEAIAKAEGK